MVGISGTLRIKLRSNEIKRGWAKKTRDILTRINAEDTSPEVERVVWLLEALVEAESLRVTLAKHATSVDWRRVAEDHNQLLRHPQPLPPNYGDVDFDDSELQQQKVRYRDLLTEINRRLRIYKWHPSLLVAPRFFLPIQVSYVSPGQIEAEEWETSAVQWLLGHSSLGGGPDSPAFIARFRKCVECREIWFYSTRGKNHKYCSKACDKKHHSRSEEFKEKRRKYMRRYRKDTSEQVERYWASSGRKKVSHRAKRG